MLKEDRSRIYMLKTKNIGISYPLLLICSQLCGFSYMVKIKMQLRDADPGAIATLHKRQVWLYTIGIHLSADRPSIAT